MKPGKDYIPGVCVEGDCLLDSVYRSLCKAHAGDIPCAHCGQSEYEHITINATYLGTATVLQLCPTAVYEQSR